MEFIDPCRSLGSTSLKGLTYLAGEDTLTVFHGMTLSFRRGSTYVKKCDLQHYLISID